MLAILLSFLSPSKSCKMRAVTKPNPLGQRLHGRNPPLFHRFLHILEAIRGEGYCSIQRRLATLRHQGAGRISEGCGRGIALAQQDVAHQQTGAAGKNRGAAAAERVANQERQRIEPSEVIPWENCSRAGWLEPRTRPGQSAELPNGALAARCVASEARGLDTRGRRAHSMNLKSEIPVDIRSKLLIDRAH